MGNKPYIIPLDVPWQISPSFSDLALKYFETGAKAELTFQANLLPDIIEVPLENRVSGEPSNLGIIETGIRVSLRAFAIHIGFASEDGEEYEPYNWDKVPPLFRLYPARVKLDLKEWAIEYDRYCSAYRKFPIPNAYQILNSQWINQKVGGVNVEWEHYMFIGHDTYIEILGRDWSWNTFKLPEENQTTYISIPNSRIKNGG